MGGPGSGRKGGARGAGGRFVMAGEITMTVVDAIQPVQELKSEMDGLTDSTKQASDEMDSIDWIKMQTGAEAAAQSQKDLDLASINTMVTLQSLTSASNQLTGATYKMIAGAEASNLIGAERAVELQNTARKVELLTGAFEFMLAVEILLQVAGLSMMPTLTAMKGGMGKYALTAWNAAIATWAVLAPVLVVIAAFALAIAIIYLIAKHWEQLASVIGVLNAGFQQMLDLVMNAVGAVTGLTSGLGELGSAFTDNPLTRSLAKAGGAMF